MNVQNCKFYIYSISLHVYVGRLIAQNLCDVKVEKNAEPTIFFSNRGNFSEVFI